MASRLAVPVLFLLALLVLPTGAPAQVSDPELLADIAEGGYFEGTPYAFQSLGTKAVYLDSGSDSRPTTIWVTDGTAGGTAPLGTLCPPCGWGARPLGVIRGVAFYASSEVYSELGETTYVWRTDGTPQGTYPVTGPLRTPQGLQDMVSAAGDSRLYFTACTPAQGCELWSSDGTGVGTGPVADLAPGPAGIVVRELVTSGDVAWFLGRGPSGMGLWRADGRLHTVTRVRELPTLPRPRLLIRAGARLFFLAADSEAGGPELWTSDGTTAGTLPVTRFAAANPFAVTRFLKEIDGLVYFLADDGVSGVELWSSNGTPRGTRRVTDFAPALPFPDDPQNPFVAARLEKVGGVLLFPADDGRGKGVRLWTSRGRPRSTGPLAGCPGGCPGAREAYFARLGPLDGRVVFRGTDVAHGIEPWVSDGTGPGTRLLADVAPGQASVPLRALTSVGNRVYFERFVDQDEPREIWATDGTAAGTRLLTHGAYGESHYRLQPNWQPIVLGVAGAKAVFLGYDDARGHQLWVSDGSPAGTAALTAKIRPNGSWPNRLVAVGDRVFLTACRSVSSGTGLWTSAGSAATTVELVDVKPDLCSSEILSGAAPLGGGAILVLDRNVWRTDGTPGGTVRLPQLEGSAYIGPPLAVGGKVVMSVIQQGPVALWSTDGTSLQKYFELPGFTNYETVAEPLAFFLVSESRDNQVIRRVWRTDGTAAGTFPITSFNSEPRAAALPVPGFALLDGRVYFLTFVDGQGPQLWSTDGTPGGTKPVLTSGFSEPDSLEAEGGLLWFRARRTDGVGSRKVLWRSDGTAAGTFPLPADLSDGVLTPYFFDRFAGLGSRVFFQASDPVHGGELWTSDGTPEGTALVRDIFPGLADSHPLWLTTAGDRVWFAANGGPHGTELWSTDGTAEGTSRTTDIHPGALWSDPMWLTPAGGSLFFSAEDGVHGREPWRLEIRD